MLHFERLVRTNATFDKAFLKYLAEIVGMISRVGGLTKFASITDEIKLMVRRIVQLAFMMAKSNDFSLLDLLNGAIYSKVQSEFLT